MAIPIHTLMVFIQDNTVAVKNFNEKDTNSSMDIDSIRTYIHEKTGITASNLDVKRLMERMGISEVKKAKKDRADWGKKIPVKDKTIRYTGGIK